MQTERFHTSNSTVARRLVDLIEDGQVIGLSRLTVEQVEVGDLWVMQTLAIGIPAEGTAAFPVVVIDRHNDDDAAMVYAVRVFETLKAKGYITAEQAARYRRSLFTIVPTDAFS